MPDFMKDDTQKNRLELIEPEFIEGLGAVLTFGAIKYEAWNWRKASTKDDQDRIFGALLRHLMAYKKGEKIDPESGMSHLYHASFGLMTLDYFDRIDGDMVIPEPSPVGRFEAIMNLSFPIELTALENVITQGLRDHKEYRGWKLYGFKSDERAVILNTNDNEVIVATDFNEFVRFFNDRVLPAEYPNEE